MTRQRIAGVGALLAAAVLAIATDNTTVRIAALLLAGVVIWGYLLPRNQKND